MTLHQEITLTSLIRVFTVRMKKAWVLSYPHSGKSATIRESNHGLCVYKEHYAQCYVPKHSILSTRTDVWIISSVACRFGSTKIDYTDCLKSLISRINEVYAFHAFMLMLININFILAVCFAAITLVIVLTWFL